MVSFNRSKSDEKKAHEKRLREYLKNGGKITKIPLGVVKRDSLMSSAALNKEAWRKAMSDKKEKQKRRKTS